MAKTKKIKEKYDKAKNSKVGDSCICPSCGTTFIKLSYQQVFCKSKSGTKCKDKYWNTVDESKRNNTTRISPSNALFMARMDTPVILGHGNSQREIDREDRLNIELEDDGSWDNHQCYVERCEFCNCIICRCDN